MAVLYKGFAYKDWLTANYDEQRSLWCVKRRYRSRQLDDVSSERTLHTSSSLEAASAATHHALPRS
jgi:hypothetical protein